MSKHITLEQMGLSASVNPMGLVYTDNWFEYPGFFRRPAHCQIDAHRREGGGYTVVIATELAKNDGASITNASESLARTICEKLQILPQELILIEHYLVDRILSDHYSLVKFTRTRSRERGQMWDDFADRQWFPMDKTELERLLGVQL